VRWRVRYQLLLPLFLLLVGFGLSVWMALAAGLASLLAANAGVRRSVDGVGQPAFAAVLLGGYVR
jgi:hypothetical protein